jgi:hypothetical protein
MLSCTVVGIGAHMLTLADPERCELVLKIPRDDRYFDHYWRQRLAYLSSRLAKRRAATCRSWPTSFALALRDVLFNRDRRERQQHFAGVLDALSIGIIDETARRCVSRSGRSVDGGSVTWVGALCRSAPRGLSDRRIYPAMTSRCSADPMRQHSTALSGRSASDSQQRGRRGAR